MVRFAAGTILAAAVLAAAAALSPSPGAALVLPGSAAPPATTTAFDLIDSVGVNVHLYYSDTAYADTGRVASLLQQLGVRHVRDGLAPDRPDDVAAVRQLGAAGISSTLILGGDPGPSGPTVDQGQLAELKQVAPYADAVEPTNEYDCSGDPQWAANLHAYTQSLVGVLQADDATRQLGVLAPAMCMPQDVATYGSVAGTASVANAHDYAAGQAPELALEGRLPAWSASQGSSLPLAVTELGYHNALAAPAGNPGVSEATAADYTVRALLDSARLGAVRTYLYELLDEKPDPNGADPEQHFGLVRNDGTVKPAFTAVRNLLGDLALGAPGSVGPGSRAAAPYAVSLRGGGGLLRSMVVADPNGGGQTVALWLATPLENTTTHQAITDPTRTVRLAVGQDVSATTRRPSRTNATTTLGHGTAFDIPVSGAVTLVHLGAPSGAVATCTGQASYGTVANQLGASVNKGLGPAAGWSGSPSAAADVPAWVPAATEITADTQRLHVTVPNAPSSWTVTLWQRTAPGSANFATFLHATGLPLALLRTYDLVDDVPSHVQLSAYGPNGAETWGSAVPGTWHLLSLTVTTTTTTFAVDGVVAGTARSSTGRLSGLDLGAVGPGYRGALAGLAVFPKALTAANVARLATTAAVSCP